MPHGRREDPPQPRAVLRCRSAAGRTRLAHRGLQLPECNAPPPELANQRGASLLRLTNPCAPASLWIPWQPGKQENDKVSPWQPETQRPGERARQRDGKGHGRRERGADTGPGRQRREDPATVRRGRETRPLRGPQGDGEREKDAEEETQAWTETQGQGHTEGGPPRTGEIRRPRKEERGLAGVAQ